MIIEGTIQIQNPNINTHTFHINHPQNIHKPEIEIIKTSKMDSKSNNPDEEQACLDAVLFSGSHVFPLVLHTAIELNLFNIISNSGPGAYLSASEIASHLPSTNPDAPSILDRILHLFATHSLLSYAPRPLPDGRTEKTYALTPSSKFFTGTAEDGNISFISKLAFHKATIEVWLNMKDVVLDGGNLFKKIHGVSIFEYMNKDGEFNGVFNQAMVGLSSVIMKGILGEYGGFEDVEVLVDVGGGIGRVLNMIVSKYPSIKGINFDLPHVVQSAPSYPGIEHIGGSMLEAVPKGDAIMIKDTCHNWTDVNVIKVLKNINEALPENGKLIIINALMPEEPETSKASKYVARLDNTMLTQPSGKERTAKEFEILTKAAGFSNFKVACVAHGIWAVMEAFK
ncbi:caffeic acid 3-O-methyltransferase-like [Euphorbia lathyris]|uniref:caffeic acid 3-O-methyltransferase-like n=1 Tax=Euphorbia lathyris TaxID=212925 RepID=UPI003313F57F